MNDFGRRYFVSSGTAGGKHRIAQICFIVAMLIQIVLQVADSSTHFDNRLIQALVGFSAGITLVSAVFLYLNRKSS
ncbi:MAG TPA: hypothetical protein VHT05_05035 [Candidatus Elarobacter sp.]|nr:hypothetical protein [Candidatus Elarobacter sp.]